MSESVLGTRGAITVIEPQRQERVIARRSAEARAVVPTVEYATVVDMEPALARASALGGEITAVVVNAVARALTRAPRVNGAYRDGRYELYSRINIGVTFTEADQYVIPTVFDADAKDPAQVATELEQLFERARAGELTPAEIGGATFTVSVAGASEVATLTPLVLPGQAAALAAGPVREVPVVRDGRVVLGQSTTLTLACDHRIVYGAHAARFLAEAKSHLEEALT